jgi:hypothetical protein
MELRPEDKKRLTDLSGSGPIQRFLAIRKSILPIVLAVLIFFLCLLFGLIAFLMR